MRKTKIVATVGPKTQSYEMLKKLAEAGVNIFRINFSHGTREWHEKVIDNIKILNEKTGNHYGILIDTKGPEIRTDDLHTPVELKKGQELILTIDHVEYETSGKLEINYDEFINDVDVNDKILVDNGEMNLKVKAKKGADVICEVLDGGTLGSRRHINLPGKDVSLDSITDKDWEDIKFGVSKGVDFIALSFVRNVDEIQKLQKFLKEKRAHTSVIAKVETESATHHLAALLEVADGIMVARGDLGAEIPFAQVPLVQMEILKIAAKYKKPVIVATHMLESMRRHPMPTRAEVTDVFTAVWQEADATMLSAETGVGEYPIKSVEAMRDIALETESKCNTKCISIRHTEVECARTEFCKNAKIASEDLPEIGAIVVVTRSGYMARLMSAFRPQVPIIAVSNESKTCRNMQLLWGVERIKIAFSSNPEKTVQNAIKKINEKLPIMKGKKFVLISDILIEGDMMPALQIREF